MYWILGILIFLLSIITYRLAKYLRAKTEETKLVTLRQLGRIAVSVIEQMDTVVTKFRESGYTISMINPSKDMENLANVDKAAKSTAKKALAVTMLTEMASRHGIKTTPAMSSAIIEAELNNKR